MTRKELTHDGYRAIAVNAIGEKVDQSGLRQTYSQLRTSQYCEARKEPSLRLEVRCVGNSKCEYQGRTCRLFAVNGGKKIPMAPPNAAQAPPTSSKQNNMANYSFVLVTNDCELMDDCVTQIEDQLGLMEEQAPETTLSSMMPWIS